MRGPGDVLLVSTYELGHAPHGVAVPAAHLERAGFRPAGLDLAVEPLDEARLRLAAAARVRAIAPDAVLCFHRLYAPLNAALLLGAGGSAILGAEPGEEL